MRHHTHPAYYTAQPCHMIRTTVAGMAPNATWDMPRNRQLALRVYRQMRCGQLPPSKSSSASSSNTNSRTADGSTAILLGSLTGSTPASLKRLLSCAARRRLFREVRACGTGSTPEERQAEVYRACIEELQKRFNQPTVSTSPTPHKTRTH